MESASILDRVLDRIIAYTSYLACALFLFSWLSVCTEVLCRYFLNRPIVWVVEVTEYILVQIAFLAGAWALKNEAHVSVDLVVSHLNKKVRAFIYMMTSLTGTIVCMLLTCWGSVAVWGAFRDNLIIPKQIGMPKYLVMIVIPLGCFLLFCQFIRRTRGAWRDWKSLEM
ncbi:MAG: TRAP transporter small permease [Deltaproteobacteria bacterium]|nr:TRAP transporter small permease [Deltaproteobacteria bacterium]